MADNYSDNFGKPLSRNESLSSDNTDGDPIYADDERLLRITFDQDAQKGCELLFRRYYVNLCNHAIRFVHSQEIAEDIVCEVFAYFWQNRIFEQITTSYRAYLYKCIRHRSYNHLKWQLSHQVSTDLNKIPVATEDGSPDEILQFTELHQRVEAIIQKLPPQCRRAYLLKRVEGKKYYEIALELKISAKAVEALVSRALLRLRTELRDEWFLGGLVVFCLRM
jgi:RNA polymerase sigma-70 factor (family 1)